MDQTTDSGGVSELWDSVVSGIRTEYLSEDQNYPWIVGFSGGKDSTLVVQAVLEALMAVAPSRRRRDVHIVSNDTQVESPLVMEHLHTVQEAIRDAVKKFRNHLDSDLAPHNELPGALIYRPIVDSRNHHFKPLVEFPDWGAEATVQNHGLLH